MDGNVGQIPTAMSGWCPGGKKVRIGATALRVNRRLLVAYQ
jgi:hypothetical protein